MHPQPRILDFRLIAAEFRKTRIAAGNLIERQRSPRLEAVPGATPLVEGLYRATANTLQAAMFLCEDRESDLTRERRYAVAVPPMVRAIADALFTVVFVFDDLPKNVRWFWSSGWHNSEATLRRMEARHAGDVDWRDQLVMHRRVQDDRRTRWGIDLTEQADLKLPKLWWPNPGAMRKYSKAEDRRAFLTHLHDWSYGRLSSSSHLSAPGLETHDALLVAKDVLPDGDDRIERFVSDQMFLTLTLFLAFVSELEHELGLKLAPRLQYLWLVIGEYAWWTEDLYKLRYRRLLAAEGES